MEVKVWCEECRSTLAFVWHATESVCGTMEDSTLVALASVCLPTDRPPHSLRSLHLRFISKKAFLSLGVCIINQRNVGSFFGDQCNPSAYRWYGRRRCA
jgi:hypothetical protein